MDRPAPDGGSSGSISFHELLRQFAPDSLERFGSSMPLRQRQVLERILRCRTPALGGQLFGCGPCRRFAYRYHSCNDRHCPLCGQSDADLWLQHRQRDLLLPTPYFLLTFTVHPKLRPLIRSHLRLGLDCLFAASSKALQDLAANPKRLGAQLGSLAVLHTWSRTLIFHPHVHFLVPAGGLSPDHRSWIASKPNFLLDVKALGAHFRTLFKNLLRRRDPHLFAQLPPSTWKRRFVVHCKPVGSGKQALGYLSRYLFKTATANRELQLLPEGRVRWPYRDNTTGHWNHIRLSPQELIRRFLQHVLPSGYSRVRYFGWFHPASKVRANRVRALLHQAPVLSTQEQKTWQWPKESIDPEPADLLEKTSVAAPLCPGCNQSMKLLGTWRAGQPPPIVLHPRPPP